MHLKASRFRAFMGSACLVYFRKDYEERRGASQPMKMIGGLLGALKTGMHVVETDYQRIYSSTCTD